MTSFPDSIISSMLASARFVEELRSPIYDLHARLSTPAFASGHISQMAEWIYCKKALQQVMYPDDLILSQIIHRTNTYREMEYIHNILLSNSAVEQAMKTAELAQTIALPSGLESFRTPIELLATRLLHAQATTWWREAQHLSAFSQVSALSDMLAERTRVGRELQEAGRAIALSGMPSLATLGEYRSFLDTAGLNLPRWPRIRLMTAAEKRRQFKNWLRENAESSQVKKAKSLVHRYELTLREILDVAMAEVFGEDWAECRLPLCGCKDLLGKWQKRGGKVLDHADYAHYAHIMTYPEHFEAVFMLGFADREALNELMLEAGRLRAASHHPHSDPFAPEDLRDLRIIWRTIEAGLIALMADYTVESWS